MALYLRQIALITIFIHLQLLVISTMSLVKRDTRCPVFMDEAWKFMDGQCGPGKRYHCFEDRDDRVFDSGCFVPKQCLKGSHPVREGQVVVCALCETGFQRENGLKSNEYAYSYCNPHSAPCNPEYGQSECLPATRASDRACTCNATLGYSPGTNTSDCQCFTPNAPCPACVFTGCPSGWVKNDREYCKPEKTTTPVMPPPDKPQAPTPPSSKEDSLVPGAIAAIILVLLAVAGLAIGLCFCHKKELLCWKKEELLVEEEKVPMTKSSANGISDTAVARNSTTWVNIGTVKNLHLHNGGTNPEGLHEGDSPIFRGGRASNGPPGIAVPGSDEAQAPKPEQKSPAQSPSGAEFSNDRLPPGTAEQQPQDTPGRSSAADADPAKKLSELGPGPAHREEAPPLLPSAPTPPLDPSAPPPSLLLEDQGPVVEDEEDPDETLVKRSLLLAAADETQVKASADNHTEETSRKILLMSED